MSASSPTTTRSVAVILVNWNGWRDTIECLDTLLASTAAPMHVYLVDNASSDGSIDHIRAWLARPTFDTAWPEFDGVEHVSRRQGDLRIAVEEIDAAGVVIESAPNSAVTLLHAGGNLGFAGGNNIGIRKALEHGFQWFWLLNTDTVVRADALEALLNRAHEVEPCDMVGSSLIYYRNPGRVQATGGGRLDLRTASVSHIGGGLAVENLPQDGKAIESEMAYVIGASMFVSRRFIEQVGLMQDDYFLYFEEIDWAFRGKPEFKLGYAPKSIVYHKVGASSAKVQSEFSLNLLYRNRVRFISRFLPERLGATKRSLVFELVRHVLKRRWMPAKLVARTLRDMSRLIASAPPVKST